MSENIAQWLAEVRSLQQQVSSLQHEREQAYQSAENWRRLYESEAQQRRREAAANGQKIDELKAVARNQGSQPSQTSPQTDQRSHLAPQRSDASSHQSIESLPVETLQRQLIAAQTQCDQLRRSLQSEEKAHAQTRESLTAALGDTVDLLAKERLAATQRPQSES
ncbi:MAG: hypothetical protein WA783_08915 [Phormidesmis sp.]